MKAKPVVPREQANRDVDEAIGRYLNEGGKQVGSDFIEALERTYSHIGRHPASGSSRYAHELNLPGVRSSPPRRHVYLVFYLEDGDRIDVWRVLHGKRDIPAWMQEIEST